MPALLYVFMHGGKKINEDLLGEIERAITKIGGVKRDEEKSLIEEMKKQFRLSLTFDHVILIDFSVYLSFAPGKPTHLSLLWQPFGRDEEWNRGVNKKPLLIFFEVVKEIYYVFKPTHVVGDHESALDEAVGTGKTEELLKSWECSSDYSYPLFGINIFSPENVVKIGREKFLECTLFSFVCEELSDGGFLIAFYDFTSFGLDKSHHVGSRKEVGKILGINDIKKLRTMRGIDPAAWEC